jgi:phosphate transport system substrate-binding protein
MGMAEVPAAKKAVMASGELPMVDPLNVTGDVISAGSSTVFPLAERMAERFQEEGYSGQITIDSIGSGAGFSRFCEAGETDVSNASRPIREEEIANCGAIDREPIEFRVGTDALAVSVSQENDFVDDVTMEELAAIFSTAETWADVRAEWPAEPIQRFIPGTDSGTFDYFVEEVFDEDEEPILGASNLQLSEDDNVLVQGIAGQPVRDWLLWVCLLSGKPGCYSSVGGRWGRADGGECGRQQLSAVTPAVYLQRCGDHAGQTAGGGLHQLLPDVCE